MGALTEVIRRVAEATNDHDLDRLVGLFADGYVNHTPVHPARGFVGREQVRRNWTQIFTAVPDITTEILDHAEVGDAVWSEWEMRGTRADGTPHLMRGVIVFRVADDSVVEARFYLEPVDQSTADVDDAVRKLTGAA